MILNNLTLTRKIEEAETLQGTEFWEMLHEISQVS
jgi:hypothetical protein